MSQPKCIGIIGRLFGHKFIKNRGYYTYTSDSCWRCGLCRDTRNDACNVK